uniref:chitinase n=1 Tax=Bacillus altitudinis TaxID=293387 RepID=A0A7H1K1N9_BACAB|nr:chitinase [Bacillus altitudinis]
MKIVLINKSKKFFVFSFIFVMLLSLSFANGEVAKASSQKSYKIIAYYPSWGYYGRDWQVWEMDVSKVSHINYAFAYICWEGRHGNPDPTGTNPQTWSCQNENGMIDAPNGTIVMGDPWIWAQKSNPGDVWDEPIRGNFKQLLKLKKSHPHLKTFISVGGWAWSNRFSDVAAQPAARENFAASAVEFLRKYGFDFVDLDWEYPVSGGLPGNSTRPEDKRNYTLLLQEVRKKLDVAEAKDGKEYLLTIASGASQDYVSNTELDKIAQTVDWINIMTYDFNGGWQSISAHNAPLFYDPEYKEAWIPSSAPVNVRVTGKTATSVSLAWDAPSSGANIAEYLVSFENRSISVKETSAEIGGLKPGTYYSFTVSAKDADGKLHAGPTVEVEENSDQACSYDEWKETSAYTGGERVRFNGKVYEAKWWTKGDRPDQSGWWAVWRLIGGCE